MWLKMWILLRLRFWICEFIDVCDFVHVNFRINCGLLPQCVIGANKKSFWFFASKNYCHRWFRLENPKMIVEWKSTDINLLKITFARFWPFSAFYIYIDCGLGTKIGDFCNTGYFSVTLFLFLLFYHKIVHSSKIHLIIMQ